MPSKSSLQDDAAPAAAGPAPGSQPRPDESEATAPAATATADPGVDVRSSRIYVFSRGPVSALVRRMLSVLALVVLDVEDLPNTRQGLPCAGVLQLVPDPGAGNRHDDPMRETV